MNHKLALPLTLLLAAPVAVMSAQEPRPAIRFRDDSVPQAVASDLIAWPDATTPSEGEPTPAQRPVVEPARSAASDSTSEGPVVARPRIAKKPAKVEEPVLITSPDEVVATPDPGELYFHQGHFRHRDDDGRVLAEGDYVEGKRQGGWSRWYHAGRGDMFSGPFFKEFKRPFIGKTTFVDGQLTGTWKVFDSDDRPIGEWELNPELRPHGKAVWWYPSGEKKREVEYQNGLVHGALVEWSAEGKQTLRETYVEGRQLVAKKEFYEAGKPRSEGSFLLAGQIFRCTCNWWTGGVATEEVAMHDENQMHGAWTWWHDNGRIKMQGQYDQGEANGKFAWYFDNGQKSIDGHYASGKQDGAWSWWYEGGMKHRRGQYKAGEPFGRWVSYNEAGGLVEVHDDYSRDTPTQTLAAVDPLAKPRLTVGDQRPVVAATPRATRTARPDSRTRQR